MHTQTDLTDYPLADVQNEAHMVIFCWRNLHKVCWRFIYIMKGLWRWHFLIKYVGTSFTYRGSKSDKK